MQILRRVKRYKKVFYLPFTTFSGSEVSVFIFRLLCTLFFIIFYFANVIMYDLSSELLALEITRSTQIFYYYCGENKDGSNRTNPTRVAI